MCITPDSATYWKTLNFVDTTNGIKFTIDCLATARSLGIEPKQFSHPQVQRVVEGWKAACGYANVEDGAPRRRNGATNQHRLFGIKESNRTRSSAS